MVRCCRRIRQVRRQLRQPLSGNSSRLALDAPEPKMAANLKFQSAKMASILKFKSQIKNRRLFGVGGGVTTEIAVQETQTAKHPTLVDKLQTRTGLF